VSDDHGLPVLDRPVWYALTGRQAALARGKGPARRFAPDYGPFAATADISPRSLAALADLSGEGEIWLIEKGAIACPAGMTVIRSAECLQMVASMVPPDRGAFAIEPLGEEDAGAMRALATLTEPGPFLARTHRLGNFVGIKSEGRLVAMAGERMRPGAYTEVSGVCTDLAYRGRGYAGALMRRVAARILERGERPFLHCYASNAGAIALYTSLGFEAHQTVTATVMRRG
jgi:predicted GNAT family acetyltransferase